MRRIIKTGRGVGLVPTAIQLGFIPETLIATATRTKPIGEIQVGDIVRSPTINEPIGELKRVTRVLKTNTHRVCHLGITNHNQVGEIRCSPYQRFFHEGGWRRAEDFKPGQLLKEYYRLGGVTSVRGCFGLIALEVEGNDCYVVVTAENIHLAVHTKAK